MKTQFSFIALFLLILVLNAAPADAGPVTTRSCSDAKGSIQYKAIYPRDSERLEIVWIQNGLIAKVGDFAMDTSKDLPVSDTFTSDGSQRQRVWVSHVKNKIGEKTAVICELLDVRSDPR